MDDLERVVAAQACRDAVLRYCRGLDRLDAGLMRSAYLPGAVDDHGSFVGDGWAFCDRVVASHRRYDATLHCVLNHAVDVAGPDAARGEAYVVTHVLRTADDGVRWHDSWYGRYADRYGRADGGRWGIAHRVCVHEWTESAPAGPPMPQPVELFAQGRDDRGTGAVLGPAAFSR
jgi:hypothetical protein